MTVNDSLAPTEPIIAAEARNNPINAMLAI